MTPQYSTRYSIDPSGVITRKSCDMILGPTSNTPFVKYSESSKILIIKGNSSKVDMHHFYYPFISKVKDYLVENTEFTIFFYFKDFNTSTAKVLFDFFKFVSRKNVAGYKIEVVWGADSDHPEMVEAGKDFAELYGLDVKFLTEKYA